MELQEWTFKKTLKGGKQGVVCLFQKEKDYIVVKISQCFNYVIEHEYLIMKELNTLSFCPHFCRVLDIQEHKLNANFKTVTNPFELDAKHNITKNVLIIEYIKGVKFFQFIKDETVEDKVCISIIKQVLLALCISQKEKKFTHYDLHSYNIIIKKCDPDLVHLYVLDEENQFCVPTYGFYPVIIDFGFSFIQTEEPTYLLPGMTNIDIGFTSDRFDRFADAKLFLISVSNELLEFRKLNLFRRIVKNIFCDFKVDMECGWDKASYKSITDYFPCKGSRLFDKYGHYCIEIIQSVILLPLENHFNNESELILYLDRAYSVFSVEWLKIEHEISDPFYLLYILRGIVDAVKDIKPYYMDETSRKKAVSIFKNSVHDTVNRVVKFCSLKHVDFNKLFCGILFLAECIEGLFYKLVSQKTKERTSTYKKMLLSSVEQIYATIDINIPSTYTYTSNTVVKVINGISKTNYSIDITSKLQTINKQHHLLHGVELFTLI